MPLIGWVTCGAETLPASVSLSRCSKISLCLTSKLSFGLFIFRNEDVEGHSGLKRAGAKIHVKIGQIQSPPLPTVPQPSLPGPHQRTSTSQETRELSGYGWSSEVPFGAAWYRRQGQLSAHVQEA